MRGGKGMFIRYRDYAGKLAGDYHAIGGEGLFAILYIEDV